MKRKLTLYDFAVWLAIYAIIAALAVMTLLLLFDSGYKHENVEPNWKARNEIKRIYNETR